MICYKNARNFPYITLYYLTTFLQDWVRLRPLQVDEGGRVSISSENLELVVDYSKYGIRDDDIIFHVIMQPNHGVVDLTEWERNDVKLFSLSNINNDQVCHNKI